MRYIILIFTFLYLIPSIALAQKKVPQSLVDEAFKSTFSDTLSDVRQNTFLNYSYFYGSFTAKKEKQCLICANMRTSTASYSVEYALVKLFTYSNSEWSYKDMSKLNSIISTVDINNDEVSEILCYELNFSMGYESKLYMLYSVLNQREILIYSWIDVNKQYFSYNKVGDTLLAKSNFSFISNKGMQGKNLLLNWDYKQVVRINDKFEFNDEKYYSLNNSTNSVEIDLPRLYAIAQKKARLIIPH